MTKQLPGMPPENQYEGTPLGDAFELYAANKNKIARAKLAMGESEQTILSEMKSRKIKIAKATIDSKNFEFEYLEGKDKIRCEQITKDPAKKTVRKKLDD